ncbi:hypothetical protein AB0M36_21325 [Actinoplanes sp. NPDC051346]|uniref:hypothetical protein n=1 Tax=Actinoplanes sp. NPDC051346 TaxID=3155048 RepID=UPI00344AE030
MKIKYAVLAVALAGSLAACTPAESDQARGTGAPAAQATAPAEKFFGPDGYGKLTIAMTEKDALATGELQDKPVSTVSGKHVYSLPGGPTPDPKRMKADEKIAAAAEAAEKSTDTSAAGSAKSAKAYADETQRITDRLVAYLEAGGAAFIDGKMSSIAAPKDAKTPEGIKRGSTEAELKAAYAGKGLTKDNELPLAGHPGWTILFELDKGVVKYMSIGKAS